MVQAGLEVRCFAGSQAGSVYFFSRCACLISFAGVAQLVEQLICNQQVGGSSPSTSSIGALRATAPKQFYMGVFPSGQRGQTVNLLSLTSVVRIHPLPPSGPVIIDDRPIFSVFIRLCGLFCFKKGRSIGLIVFDI